MNKQTFIQLIQHPENISEEQAAELERMLRSFPYCQSGYILLAKYGKTKGSMHAEKNLTKAALYTSDRNRLKTLLEGANKQVEPASIHKVLEVLPEEKKTPLDETQTLPIKEIEIKPLLTTEELVSETNEKEQKTDLDSKEALLDELRNSLLEMRKNRIQNTQREDIPIENKQIESPQKEKTDDTQINETITVVPISEIITNTKEIPVTKEGIYLHRLGSNTVLTSTELVKYKEILPSKSITFHPDDNKELGKEDGLSEQLLHYLHYTEQKRAVFRKNKKKEEEIINKLIQEEPAISKLNINRLPEEVEDLSERSTQMVKGPVSENYAKILTLQGKKDKAIDIYQQLILKNPEKKAYFETQIEKLKLNIK